MTSLNDAFIKFDPNIPESHQPYATFAPGREGKVGGVFRQHCTRGAAFSAVTNNRNRVKLYRWDESQNRWEQLAVIDGHNKPDRCTFCGVKHMTRDECNDFARQARAAGKSLYALGVNQFFFGNNNGTQGFARERSKIMWPLRVVTACPGCSAREGIR